MSASPIGVKHEASLVAGPFRALAAKSDKRLVELAQRGDTHAVEVLYDRYALAILRYCRSLLRSAQEAEDVQQEVFLQALSALRDGAGPETFRPWLYRVAHNACISHMRAKRPHLTAVDGDFVAAAVSVEPASDEREELRQLLDDLSALPEVQRGALLLREMDGFSYEQVGEVLGLPVTTVRSTIFRARSTLQGLAEARDAKCTEIQAELSRLADRRGRRSRRITSHLKVCGDCRQFRDGLRERPTILRGFLPALPLGVLEGAETIAAEGAGIATAGAAFGASSGFGLLGGGGAAKLIAAAASTCALVGGAGTQIGVLGGGSGAAVDAESSTVASEPAVTALGGAASGTPGERHHAAATRRLSGDDLGSLSYAAPGTVIWRPATDGATRDAGSGRDGHRLAVVHGAGGSGRGHASTATGNRQWGSAVTGGQFHSLAASESGFLIADDGGPQVRRHERESVREADRPRERDRSGSTEASPREESAPTTEPSEDQRSGDEPRQEPTATATTPAPAPTATQTPTTAAGPAAAPATEPATATADPGTYTPPPSDTSSAPPPAPVTAGPGEASSTQLDPAPATTTTTSSEPAPQDPAASAP